MLGINDGNNNTGSFTEVSNMIANLEQNKELFESMNSRATFARHQRKQGSSTERLEKQNNNLYEIVLEKTTTPLSPSTTTGRTSSGTWTVEEIPLNPRQSKNLMETLNETPLKLTVTIQEEGETTNIRSDSIKSDVSITTFNELYDETKSETDDTQTNPIENSDSSSKKRTPQQFKKSKFDSFIPNSIKNMFLSTKRSQRESPSNSGGGNNSFYQDETPEALPIDKQKKENKKNGKSNHHRRRQNDQQQVDSPASSSSDSNPAATATEDILSQWLAIFENFKLSKNYSSTSTSTINKTKTTTESPSSEQEQNKQRKISMSGMQLIELLSISSSNQQQLAAVPTPPLDNTKQLLYALIHTLIVRELVVQQFLDENHRLSSLASNPAMFESIQLEVYPDLIKEQKDKVIDDTLQFLSHHYPDQVSCQPNFSGSATKSDNNTEQDLNKKNQHQHHMLLQHRRESTLLLSFEEFLNVNNQKMGSSQSHDDTIDASGSNSIINAENLESLEKQTTIDNNNHQMPSQVSNADDEEISQEASSQTTITADLTLLNSSSTIGATILSNLGSNVSNHIKQANNSSSTSNCTTNNNNNSPSTPTPTNNNSSTPSSSTSELSPYETKLFIGEKSLFELKQQLRDRKHRYGFLTPTQFLEFGLRAGFDEEEFASIFAVTYSTLMSAHQLIPQMESVMKCILNDEKLPKPITGDEEEEDETLSNNISNNNILEDDFKLSIEEKNNIIGRVARFLKQFVLLSFSDFQYDKQFHESLYSFVAPLIGFINFEGSSNNGELIQEQVVDLVERITLVISGAHEDQFCQTEQPPKALIKKLPSDPRRISLLDIDPIEIARQLTLFEFSSFEKLSAKELLGASWMKDSKEWTAPNVTQLIWRSNQLTDWVSTFICSINTLKERKRALKHLIHVAEACLEIHNYNTVFEIVMGLISQPVYRLKKTWEVLKENDLQRVWKRLEDITSFPGNRRVYRDQIQKVIKESVTKLTPCLPYLGVHLSDLVFFDEGNKDSMEKGVTTFYNCTKRACMGQIVYQIIAVKKIPYNFQKVDLIEQFIWWQFNSKVLHDEDQRDKLSKKCEP